MRRLLFLLPFLAMPAYAHEFNRGGPLCSANVPYSACYEIAALHGATKRLDGWYASAGTTWLGYPQACIVDGSDTRFEFHAVRTPAVPPNSSPWVGIIHDEPIYHQMMTKTPWGTRIYNHVRSLGWLDTPEIHELSGMEAIAFGVPRCK